MYAASLCVLLAGGATVALAQDGSVPPAPQRAPAPMAGHAGPSAASANAGRLKSLLGAKSAARVARQPSRSQTTQAASAGAAMRGPAAAGRVAGAPTASSPVAAPRGMAHIPTQVHSPAIARAAGPAAIGGAYAVNAPRSAASVRLGGPVSSKAAHSGALDGGQLHRKP